MNAENTYVTLTPDQWEIARAASEAQVERAIRKGWMSRAREVVGDDRRRNSFLGCAGEAAFSSWLGIPYHPDLDGFHSRGDVCGYEVRTSPLSTTKVKGEEAGAGADDDERIIVGVKHVEGRTYRIVGWIRAGDGKRAVAVSDPGGRGAAHFVPHRFLRPLSDLPITAELWTARADLLGVPK